MAFYFELIYFVIVLVYGFWLISIYMNSPIVGMLSSMMLLILSLYIFQYGIGNFSNSLLMINMFSAVTFAVGAYTSYQSGYALYQDL